MYKAVILDVDGVVTPFVSAWQRLHAVFGIDASFNRLLYKRGLIDYYEWALYDVLLWWGAPRRAVEAYFQTTRGLEALCQMLKEAGVYTIAVSAGVGYTRALGHCFHFYVVNDLVYRDGAVYSVSVQVSDKNKDSVASAVLDLLGVEWREAVAVGDGEADLPMLRKAGYSIAFNPASEEVARAAKAVIRADSLYPLSKYLRAVLSGSR
ncbi:MAG: HAD family phosphatase [Pyrobaculum sp.]